MKNQTNNLEPALSQQNRPNDILLSPHFRLNEFLNIAKYPDNKPTLQDVVNMAYGCQMLLEPARIAVGPIIVNSSSASWISSRPLHTPTSC